MSGLLTVEDNTLPSNDFLRKIKKFNHFMIKFETANEEPFKYIYFKITKKELIETVRSNKMVVKYQIRYNSEFRKNCADIVYVLDMRMTILD